jgi:hypothetical protein
MQDPQTETGFEASNYPGAAVTAQPAGAVNRWEVSSLLELPSLPRQIGVTAVGEAVKIDVAVNSAPISKAS